MQHWRNIETQSNHVVTEAYILIEVRQQCLWVNRPVMILASKRNPFCKQNDTGSAAIRRTHAVDQAPEVIKLFKRATQLSMNFIMLINVKMPTIVGILLFISRINTTSES